MYMCINIRMLNPGTPETASFVHYPPLFLPMSCHVGQLHDLTRRLPQTEAERLQMAQQAASYLEAGPRGPC
jgi:hypothetical protein